MLYPMISTTKSSGNPPECFILDKKICFFLNFSIVEFHPRIARSVFDGGLAFEVNYKKNLNIGANPAAWTSRIT